MDNNIQVYFISNERWLARGWTNETGKKIIEKKLDKTILINRVDIIDENGNILYDFPHWKEAPARVMGSIQQFFKIWISVEDIFVTFSDAKDALTKRKSKTIVENVFNIFEKKHYCVFFIHNQNRYKGTLNKEYFFNDVDNLNYFKITDIFEIKYFNKCAMFPADFQTVYLPETKLFSSMSFLKEEYEDELKSLKPSTTPFTGLLKEERYDDTTGI